MRKSFIKKTLSIILVLTLFLSLFITNSYASTYYRSASDDEATVLPWKDKIDEDIFKEFESLDVDDKLPVWVWFFDLQENTIEDKVQEKTGLTLDKLSVKHNYPTEKIEKLLSNVSNVNDIQNKNNIIKNDIKTYFENKITVRETENKRTKLYLKTKRAIAKELYSKYNNTILTKLKVDLKDVLFQSTLTPSCVLNLTKEQICSIAKNEAVKSLDYSKVLETDALPPESDLSEICSNPRQVMNVDTVQNIHGLTGTGVNVLVVDHGWIRPSQECYSQLNTSNIKNLYKKHLYDTDNEQILPNNNVVSHPNLTVGELQKYASNVNIVCASTPFQYSEYNNITKDMSETFKDLEWAIINQNVNAQIIDASCCFNNDQEYTEISKWFDALVETCNITVIASAGNTLGQHYRVITPANAYNTIAIGAYNTNGIAEVDYRHDFVYKPTDSNTQINYKPDMVVAAGSTSEAAPTLTGIASMLIEFDPTLAAKPELLKAILMASCHRKVNQYPESTDPQELIENGLTQKQGSGAVDAFKALSILIKGTYATGTISSGSITSSPINIQRDVPVNVSLVWLRNNTLPSTSYDYSQTTSASQQELKLEVLKNNSVIETSNKTNTYKQMVYFDNEVANSNYTIKITKTYGTNENTRYAYAWSTKDRKITLTTNNTDRTLSKQEVINQLSNAGISPYDVSELFTVDFDDSVTAIGEQAFYAYYGGYPNLSKAILHSSIRQIGQSAFYNCQNLTQVKFMEFLPPTVRNNAFGQLGSKAIGYTNSKNVGYPSTFENLKIINVEDLKRYYFTNNKNWNDVYVYMWNSNVPYYNTKKHLDYSYMNKYGQSVYTINIDYNKYDKMYFMSDEYGTYRTVDIDVGTNGIEYYPTSGHNGVYNVGTYIPNVKTVGFLNSENWNQVKAYLWKSGSSQNNIWPGIPMLATGTFHVTYPGEIFLINFDYNEYDNVIFSNGSNSNQTVDISINSEKKGIWYRLTGDKIGNKWVTAVVHSY